MSSYWNTFIKIPPTDACEYFRMQSRNETSSIMQECYKEYKLYFFDFPQSCPIMPGKYLQVNTTIPISGIIYLPNNPIMAKFDFPNGRYRFDILASEEDRSSYFRWGFVIEVFNRLGDDRL